MVASYLLVDVIVSSVWLRCLRLALALTAAPWMRGHERGESVRSFTYLGVLEDLWSLGTVESDVLSDVLGGRQRLRSGKSGGGHEGRLSVANVLLKGWPLGEFHRREDLSCPNISAFLLRMRS